MADEHIDDVLLRLFAGGHARLPKDTISAVQSHLQFCMQCNKRLDDLIAPGRRPVTASQDHITHSVSDARGKSSSAESKSEEASGDSITQILARVSAGDESATEQLWQVINLELHRLARHQLSTEEANRTFQTTMLVNEAFLRLFGHDKIQWTNRRHFFAGAARAMRQIRIDGARSKKRLKRGGGSKTESIDEDVAVFDQDPVEVLAVHEALSKLEEKDERKAEVVMLRYFAGLNLTETAEALGISTRTASCEWRFARAWLHRELSETEASTKVEMSPIEVSNWELAQKEFRRAISSSEQLPPQLENTGDARVRADVESLLDHDQRAADDFMCPPDSPHRDSHSRSEEDPANLVGRMIGDCCITEVIGGGGMGAVFKAKHVQSGCILALKLMKQRIRSQSAVDRFNEESRILSQLLHPNIAKIHALGLYDDGAETRPYFTMEYIDTAKGIVDYAIHNDLTIPERLRLFLDACEGVRYIHERGFVHCDLKPANILVGTDGTPKVIDFGVSRTEELQGTTTIATDIGQLVGTLQFMSPEQCEADAHQIDSRSDIYALGIIMYMLLAKQLPYDVAGKNVFQGIKVIMETAPAKPSSLNSTLDSRIDAIVLKTLAKDPDERYESVKDLAADIDRYLGSDTPRL